jgi:hypothetical protein
MLRITLGGGTGFFFISWLVVAVSSDVVIVAPESVRMTSGLEGIPVPTTHPRVVSLVLLEVDDPPEPNPEVVGSALKYAWPVFVPSEAITRAAKPLVMVSAYALAVPPPLSRARDGCRYHSGMTYEPTLLGDPIAFQ